jgi:hypothetical protein
MSSLLISFLRCLTIIEKSFKVPFTIYLYKVIYLFKSVYTLVMNLPEYILC